MPPQEQIKKEKKTRRRLRLSCVECTKRRQRCDRSYPCGLCVSRGVAHLCRWENVPVARPTPARPPVIPGSAAEDTIQQLSARIASLEQTVVAERLRNSTLSGSSPHSNSGLSLPIDFSPHDSVVSLQSPSSGTSPYSSPEPYSQDDEEPFAATPLPDNVYQTVATLAQHSVAHYGEFVGSGSLLSALYTISPKTMPRLPHVGSTQPSTLFSSLLPNDTSLNRLIQALPPSSTVTSLCQIFFRDFNWRFGIPSVWFQTTCSAMWNALRHPHPTYINPNWLSLLFAVLALVSDENPEHLFSCATAARRIAEGVYLTQPSTSQRSPAHGSVLSALAAPLLCDYMAERGHVSEAWKLAGNAIIGAEALGLHRDPNWHAWHKLSGDSMNDDEKLLRRSAWWGLFVCERMYGLVLGRPNIIRAQSDVTLPSVLNLDGTRNSFNVYQTHLIQLLDLAGEVNDRCFALSAPISSVAHALDRKFEKWESQLPAELRSDKHPEMHNIPDDLDGSELGRQRYWLTTWYLLCRAKLHVSFLTNFDDTTMFLGVWEHPLSRNRSRQMSISFASELIRLQCNAHQTRCRSENGINWAFTGCFSLFEGAMTVASLLSQQNWQGRPGEPDTLVHQAMMVLTQVANEGPAKGTIARLGSEALEALIHELSGRQGTPTGFEPSLSSFMPNGGSYEWYSHAGAFGTEYSSPNSDAAKEVPRFNMDLQLLMSYEESKVGLLQLDTFETRIP
ncbi:hypothetical protein C8F01DRAFT_253018 [Mycena amicta]|nr:hypothetical protein C8F01DRAFT_253018 [Mycena amicta]